MGFHRTDSDVEVKDRIKVDKPNFYRVILYNDNYTPMQFVVLILLQIFNKTTEDATNIMINIHNSGKGVAGVYPYEIAEMKVLQVQTQASAQGFPLQCELEEDI